MPVKSTTHPLFLETFAQLSSWRREQGFGDGKQASVGFVPTMGALHAGHMALVRSSVQECRKTVVSIFVNPLQFGKNEDLDRYPRPLERDLEMCREAGVDAVFHPGAGEMYPRGQEEITRVIPPESLTERLCGLFRPGHFTGVATVVAKLFGLVMPEKAFFGEKDYQQLTVIRQMAADLDMPLEIVPVPTVREPDGLAMSSRNVYLNAEQRVLAPELYKILRSIADEAADGKVVDAALEAGRRRIAELPGTTLQYLEACHPLTLQPVHDARDGVVVLVAAKLGDVRMIDNVIVRV